MDRSLTNEEVDAYQMKIRELVRQELQCELR
jgi:phenylalanyl-tRNA synthetase beta subunit